MIHRIVKLLITWYLVDFEAANEMAPLNLQVNLYQSRCAIGTHPYHCLYYYLLLNHCDTKGNNIIL